jgi:threonine/homoserine/homoserine lactone efflux protein
MLFLNALLIGFCIAAPVGPIGMLCIQRSLSGGFRPGIATGLGAACADAVYGLLGAVGVAGVVTRFPMLTVFLQIGGGAFLVWLGWSIFASRARQDAALPVAASTRRAFASTFALTLSNPMTILSFVAMFAALGASVSSSNAGAWLAPAIMVAGVFAGSAAWWLCLSGTSALLRTRVPAQWIAAIAVLSACGVGLMGIVQVIGGFRRLLG